MVRILLIGFLWFLSRPALGIDVIDCNTVVPANETGVLQNDLDCDTTEAVILEDNATLELNGHAISGAFSHQSAAVTCDGASCIIVGPGELSGANGSAVTFGWNLFDSSSPGMSPARSRLTISNVTIDGFLRGIEGVEPAGRPPLRRTSATATNVTVNGTAGCGICVDVLKATNVTTNNNTGIGIAATRLRGKTITANSNGGGGLFAGSIVVNGLTANGNAGPGIRAESARLTNAQLNDNTYMGDPMDVLTVKRPRLVASMCGRSQRIAAVLGKNWRVCSGD